jgi:hypothetical protein
MEPNPSWEAASRSATEEFFNILWNQKLITVFTKTRHWSLSWTRWIQSILPHPISLIFHPPTFRSSYRSLSLWVSHQNPVPIPPLYHEYHVPHPTSPWLDQSNYTLRRVQVMKLLIMQFSTAFYYKNIRYVNFILDNVCYLKYIWALNIPQSIVIAVSIMR